MSNHIDITLVAGARPDLLATTLESFGDKLFPFFGIRTFFANIDPIFGGTEERDACVRMIRERFPDAVIFTPETPSFGAAVKRLWQATSDAHVLHMEDDWIVNEVVQAQDILPLFAPDVGMVQLAIETRERYGDDYLYITRRKRILGYEIWSKKVNAYGTSPRFIRGQLCKHYGDLLKPKLDPEKQVYKNKNKPLSRAHQSWRCRVAYGANGMPLITDIGRDWRAERRIAKVDKAGKATWVTHE